MRIAVIGCGYWGSKHVRVLAGLLGVADVVAVDPRQDRLDALSRAFPGLTTCTALSDTLDDIDAAIVATPPTTHAAMGRLLLDEGKHVLVEKPMTTRASDALALVTLAERNDLVLMAGHTFQYNLAVERLRESIVSGELGPVFYIDTARLNLGQYQSHVNVIWDLAPHDISIVNYVLGAEPTYVHAWGSRHAQRRVEDVAYLRLEYETIGATAQIHVSWLDPCKVRRVTVVGQERMAVYNDLSATEPIRIYDKGVSVAEADDSSLHEVPTSYRYGGIYSPPVLVREPLEAMDAHFIECIETGATPLTDGYSGLGVVRVIEAAQASMAQGARVKIEPLLLPTAVSG